MERTEEYAAFRAAKNGQAKAEAGSRGNSARGRDGGEVADDTFSGWSNLDDSAARGQKTTTLGWTDCGHNTWRNGHVLDPFAGSGTTLAAAVGCGRDATGIDIDDRNAELARERCGMFLTVDEVEPHVTAEVHNSIGNPKFRVGYMRHDHPRRPQAMNYGEPS